MINDYLVLVCFQSCKNEKIMKSVKRKKMFTLISHWGSYGEKKMVFVGFIGILGVEDILSF